MIGQSGDEERGTISAAENHGKRSQARVRAIS